jgi:hypothetical protein
LDTDLHRWSQIKKIKIIKIKYVLICVTPVKSALLISAEIFNRASLRIKIKAYFGVEICQLAYYIGNKRWLNGN